MKIVNGAMELEQVERPGSIGDSCAETARYAHLKMLLGDYKADYDLNQFITPLGFVRHPDVPDEWKESDFSSDQMLPLLLAIRRNEDARQLIIHARLSTWKTGNGTLVSPGLFAELVDSQVLRTTFLLAQVALFKLPYRWSDSKKWFERNDNSSGDYLNFIHIAVYAPRWFRRSLDPKHLMEKVNAYYEPEIHSAMIKNLYFNVLHRYFGQDAI